MNNKKIALINNMNNNFFSLTRYLREKGIDAHLFQVDQLDDHFLPECDTFDDISQCDYIHSIASITFRDFFRISFSPKLILSLKKLKAELEQFDLVIACGGLAILEWAGIKVDIFIPYGGDLYQSPFMFEYCIKKHFPYSWLMKKYIKYQRRAIAKTRAIVALASIDRHMYDALVRLNEKWVDWAIPMVYPLPDIDTNKWDFLNQYDFIIFSHARQGWKTALDYKGNDKAIRAYAKFIKKQNFYSKPLMVLFEYGPDVPASKALIKELDIENYVHWMPTMKRKYIYEGLKKASLVFDYFHDEVVSFGGVTFEAFCCFKAVIGNKKLTKTDIVNSIPLVHAYTEEDIFEIFMDFGANEKKYIDHGKLSREWFDEHVGSVLVDKFIHLMDYLISAKSVSLRDESFSLPQIQAYIGPDNIK